MPSDSASTFNFKVFSALILRRSWIIVLCFLGAVALAFIYIEVTTPLYESAAVLQVEKQQQLVYTPADKDKANDAEAASDDAELKTIEQALQLDGLFEQVVTSDALKADPNFLPGLLGNTDKPMSTHQIALRLKKATTIKLRHNTRLIDVAVDHPDPATAQLIAQTLVNTFISENGRSQTDTEKMAMKFLEGQAAKFKTDLQSAQDALQVYGQALLLKDRIIDQQKVVDALTQRYRTKHPKLIEARAELTQLDTQFDATSAR